MPHTETLNRSLWTPEIRYNIDQLDAIRTSTHMSCELLGLLSHHHRPTYEHVITVAEAGTKLAHVLGLHLPRWEDELWFHDIGKLLVPKHVLSRISDLDLHEHERLRLFYHSRLSAQIMEFLGYPRQSSDTVRYHHADFDKIADKTHLYVDGIFRPSLLRLADNLGAAEDNHRPYQKPLTMEQKLLYIRDRIDGRRIQANLMEVFDQYKSMRWPEVELPPLGLYPEATPVLL